MIPVFCIIVLFFQQALAPLAEEEEDMLDEEILAELKSDAAEDKVRACGVVFVVGERG